MHTNLSPSDQLVLRRAALGVRLNQYLKIEFIPVYHFSSPLDREPFSLTEVSYFGLGIQLQHAPLARATLMAVAGGDE